MNKAYERINWQNKPSTATKLNATNLNKMDLALDTIDDRVVTLDSNAVSDINDLSDVNISSATNGQILKYDSQNDEWVNADEKNEVIANPAGTPTNYLETVTIDDIDYFVGSKGYHASQSSEITVPATTNTNLITFPEIKKGTYLVCGSSKINSMPQSNVLRYIQFTMSNGDKICEMTINQAAYATTRIPLSGVLTVGSDTTNMTLIVYLREELKIAETEIGLLKIN